MTPVQEEKMEQDTVDDVHFLEISGNMIDRMFISRMPMPGETVELVCDQVSPDRIRFKLRVVAVDQGE